MKTANIMNTYAPENNKSKDEREKFYKDLQNMNNKFPRDELLFIMGYLNIRISQEGSQTKI